MNWNVIPIVAGLLIVSNIFMTFAWYGHLKDLASKPWYIAVLVSWLIAFSNTSFRSPPTDTAMPIILSSVN